jgi:hypothetical protein
MDVCVCVCVCVCVYVASVICNGLSSTPPKEKIKNKTRILTRKCTDCAVKKE